MSGLRGMFAVVLLALAAAGAGLLAGRWWFDPNRDLPPAPDGIDVVEVGAQAPALRLPDLDGSERSLDEFAGAPLLVNYWATWCPPCVKELPLLADLHARRDADGLAVLTIAMEYEPDTVAAFLRELGVDLPAWIETPSRGDSSVTFGNTRGVLPFSVLLGADGRVLARKAGELREADLADWVQRARR